MAVWLCGCVWLCSCVCVCLCEPQSGLSSDWHLLAYVHMYALMYSRMHVRVYVCALGQAALILSSDNGNLPKNYWWLYILLSYSVDEIGTSFAILIILRKDTRAAKATTSVDKILPPVVVGRCDVVHDD